MTTPPRRAVACLSALVAGLVVLAACSSPDPAPDPAPAPTPTTSTSSPEPDLPTIGRYVALGDSYTAGPGIAPGVDGSGFCWRSERNYPSLLAERLDADLVDVSCSGAGSVDVLQAGRGLQRGLPPQIEAVTARTDLVTIGIGANDDAFFDQLLRSCTGGAQPCTDFVEGPAQSIFATITQRVAVVLQEIADKAPRAEVILVGYPRIVPEKSECAALAVPEGTTPEIRLAESQLDDALAAAAQAADVTYVSMYKRTGRHDACDGAQAWTNAGSVAGKDGIVFHPRLLGMKAVADALARTVAESR